MLENKYHRVLGILFVGLLMMVGALGCFPSPPIQVSPPDGSVFDHYPRTTTLEWRPLFGAVGYRVEVDCFHCCEYGEWCTDIGITWMEDYVAGTTYTFDFVGAQPGRWRVSGIDATGLEGQRSGWWEFEYVIKE